MRFLRPGLSLLLPRVAVSTLLGIASLPWLSWAGDVQYAYDVRGRLAAVTAEDGVTYAYRYDAAGNLLSIARANLLIDSVTPSMGKENTEVTLEGVGFGGGSNVVRFNGTLAPVTSFTATQIKTRVPAGASSGPITVQNALGTATSLIDFLIVSGPPQITGFSPPAGVAGTSVLLQGSGFAQELGQNSVSLNGLTATVTSVGATTLSFTVPSGIGSGKIVLSTPEPPPVTTTQDFLVAPPNYTPADIARSVRAASFGTPVDVPLTPQDTISLLLFEASAGQRLGLEFGADAALCTTELLVRPDNTVFPTQDSTHCGAAFLDPVTLDQTGTWALVLDPDGATTGTRTVTLHDVPDNPRTALQFRTTGSTGALTTTVPGQNAEFTFQAQAGDDLSFIARVTDANPRECLTWRILRPNGTQFAVDSCVGASKFHDRSRLDATGIWTVVGDEAARAPVHTYELTLYQVPADVTMTVANNTLATLKTTTPGQNARFTFFRLFSSDVRFTGTFLTNDCGSAGPSTCRRWRIIRPDGTVLGQSSCVSTPFTSGPFTASGGFWTIEADEQGPETHCHTLLLEPQ